MSLVGIPENQTLLTLMHHNSRGISILLGGVIATLLVIKCETTLIKVYYACLLMCIV
jgi:hypothetical protein